MNPVAIIAAMPPELDVLVAALESVEESTLQGKPCYQGMLDGVPVVLTLSGIGKVNAAVTAALMIERFAPQAVINTGSAGGLGAQVRIGDVVISTEVAHHDVDVRAFGYQMGQVPQLPARFAADSVLIQAARAAASVFDQAAICEGLIVSGDQFVDGSEKVTRIRADFPEVLACEMEAAAIAQVCFQAEVPWVVIRAISDHADEQAEQSFDQFIVRAGETSAAMVRQLLKNGFATQK